MKNKEHIKSFGEHQKDSIMSNISEAEKVKQCYDMTIDGFEYHFISKKYDTKEDLEKQLEWFSGWIRTLRNKL